MRVALTADLHLSHRRYPAMAKDGRPQREVDVAAAWSKAVDGIIASDVRLCLIAGDVFDHGRPPVSAITDAMRGVQRIVRAGIAVVAISGNHDEKGTKASGASGFDYTGHPLVPLALVGAKVVVMAERVSIPSLGVHILCVPESDVRRVRLEPSNAAGTHILLAHGKFSAELYRLPEAECLSLDAIHPDFALVGLGDFHVFSELRPRVCYPGSTEFTSSNVWSEAVTGVSKGFVIADTETGLIEHQAIPTRPHIDLPRFSAVSMTAEDVAAKMLAQLEAQPIEGAVVRQVVVDCHRVTRSGVNHKAIKAASKSALHYQTDIRLPVHENRVRAMLEIEDDDTPPDGFATWDAYESWLKDDEKAQTDSDFSLADDVMRGVMPMLDTNADPYELQPRRARSAA